MGEKKRKKCIPFACVNLNVFWFRQQYFLIQGTRTNTKSNTGVHRQLQCQTNILILEYIWLFMDKFIHLTKYSCILVRMQIYLNVQLYQTNKIKNIHLQCTMEQYSSFKSNNHLSRKLNLDLKARLRQKSHLWQRSVEFLCWLK